MDRALRRRVPVDLLSLPAIPQNPIPAVMALANVFLFSAVRKNIVSFPDAPIAPGHVLTAKGAWHRAGTYTVMAPRRDFCRRDVEGMPVVADLPAATRRTKTKPIAAA